MSSCYTEWKTAKTGEYIPCFADGKPSSSLYNPQKEAENFALTVQEGYVVIVGYASGLHISEVKKRFPNSKILVVEKNDASINFLSEHNTKSFFNDIIICTPDTLQSTIVNTYFPPLDGNFSLVPLRSWVMANEDTFMEIKTACEGALEQVSADISVQSHFGKLWHNNILQNLRICENPENARLLDITSTSFPTHKTALVAGAGPSLENSIKKLKQCREDYFVIATDTAYHALSEHNIICDVVVSVDAQHISYSHFMCEKHKDTIFAFDLCANPTAAKNLMRKDSTICYFRSEHPLCSLIESWYEKNNKKSFFPVISSSGGTVTLAALNFAKIVGFTTIDSTGCDFAYIEGKMYAKGIYMDAIFNACSTKLHSVQRYFSALMFRTPLIKSEKQVTTQLLQQYKRAYNSFYDSLSNDSNKKEDSSVYAVRHKECFPYADFICYYKSLLESSENTDENADLQAVLSSVLPYIAWYSAKNANGLKEANIFEIGLNATIHF